MYFQVHVSNKICFSVEENIEFKCRLLKVHKFRFLFFKTKKKSGIFDMLLLLSYFLEDSLIPSVLSGLFHSKWKSYCLSEHSSIARKFYSVLLCVHYSLQCDGLHVNTVLFLHSSSILQIICQIILHSLYKSFMFYFPNLCLRHHSKL